MVLQTIPSAWIASNFAEFITLGDKLAPVVTSGKETEVKLLDTATSMISSVERQTHSLESTAAHIKEFTNALSAISDSLDNNDSEAKKLDQEAKQGTTVMEHLGREVEEISEAVDGLNEISNIFSAIKQKTAMIDEIVLQTKILSFNASVEAERAGEAGKGFSVVASEISALAARSRESSDEIQVLLKESAGKLTGILGEVGNKVTTGKSRTEQAHKQFEDIALGLNKMTQNIESITKSTNNQKDQIFQIKDTMEKIKQASNQNSEISAQLLQLADNITQNTNTVSAVLSKNKTTMQQSGSNLKGQSINAKSMLSSNPKKAA